MGTQFLKNTIFIVILCIVWVVSAQVEVKPPIEWLPQLVKNEMPWVKDEDVLKGVIWIITLIIQYTSVIAVIAVIYGGIQYVLSFWADDKTKKAKWIIIYALIWVGLSIAAYAMVAIVASVSNYNF